MIMTQSNYIIYLLFLSCLLCTRFDSVFASFSNCTQHDHYDSVECTSVQLLNELQVVSKRYSKQKYVQFVYFADTQEYNVCEAIAVENLFNKYNVSSCEDYFCDSPLGNLTINSRTSQSRILDHARLLNYCQYCRRRDYNAFHDRIVNNECTAFKMPQRQICSKLRNGWPLVFAPLMKGFADPHICKCNGGRYGFKCDWFSLVLEPFILNIFPYILIIAYSVLIPFNLIFYLIPFLIVRVKHLMTCEEGHFKAFIQIFDTYFFITGLVQLHLCMALLEYVFNLPFKRIYTIRRYILGDGFFTATGFVCLLLSLFTLFTLWVHVLRIARRLDRPHVVDNYMGTDLKILLIFLYILFGVLVSIPFLSLFPRIKRLGLLNYVYFPMTSISSTILLIGFATYGTMLYLKVRETRKLNLFGTKFTRFAAVVIVLLFLVDLEMLLIIIEFLRRGGPTFGITYRLINFPLLSVTNYMLVVSVLYQTFKRSLVVEVYPWMERLDGHQRQMVEERQALVR